MRGKLFERYILGNWVRITPADAGKTKEVELPEDIHTDHPRGCGENWCVFKFGGMCDRITPADAGKTLLHAAF